MFILLDTVFLSKALVYTYSYSTENNKVCMDTFQEITEKN